MAGKVAFLLSLWTIGIVPTSSIAPVAQFTPALAFRPLRRTDSVSTGFYRDIVVEEDENETVLYVGGRNNIYRIPLNDFSQETTLRGSDVQNLSLEADRVPDFGPTHAGTPTWGAVDVRNESLLRYEPYYSVLGWDPAVVFADPQNARFYSYGQDEWGVPDTHFTEREYLEYLLVDLLQAVNLDYKLNNLQWRPGFGTPLPMNGSGLIDVLEQLGERYFNPTLSYRALCEEQVRVLQAFYGERMLEMPIGDVDLVCSRHFRAPVRLKGADQSDLLFSLHSGLLGTLPVSASGINKYAGDWLAGDFSLTSFYRFLAYEYQQIITKPYYESQYAMRVQPPGPAGPPANRPPFDPKPYGYEWKYRRNTSITDADPMFSPPVAVFGLGENFANHVEDRVDFAARMVDAASHDPPSPANFLGKTIFCDFEPAPNRMIFEASTLAAVSQSVLPPPDGGRASCAEGNLAMALLSGYHPDQASVSLSTVTEGRTAVFVMAEMGQEKQLDTNREFLNMPELMPFTSSSSLIMARIYIDSTTGDVDPSSIVISNPFKYTWVTSPLNRFGRLQKTGSQDQVPYRPRAIALHEDADYVYFFFREAEWESARLGEYKIGRYHHTLTSYQRALYFPWEEDLVTTDDSERKVREEEGWTGRPAEAKYNPRLNAWRHAMKHLQPTGRVARVCKADAGLPLGVQDPNMFDLDNRLSLNAFQTFVKAKITCRIRLPGAGNYWRHRADVRHLRSEAPNDPAYEGNADGNLNGKDFTYRAPGGGGGDRMSYHTWFDTNQPRDKNPMWDSRSIFQSANYSGFVPHHYLTDYHAWKWAYEGKAQGTDAARYIEYPELRDVSRVGDTFYGVFGRGDTDEQVRRADAYDSVADDPMNPDLASALCIFSMEDVRRAFSGMFKRRENNGWRAREPTVSDPSSPGGKRPVTPDARGCAADPVKAEAERVERMRISLLDVTQPEEEDARLFDMRPRSERLDFFEHDVEGSRTMWEDVEAEPVGNFPGLAMDKIVVDVVREFTVMFVTTVQGKIYKYLLGQNFHEGLQEEAVSSDPLAMHSFLETSPLMEPLFTNRFYPYLNKTLVRGEVDPLRPDMGVRDSISFVSDLTVQSRASYPLDYVLTSDWLKKGPGRGKQYRLLSVLTPFGDTERKIWSFKLTSKTKQLILGTDEDVTVITIANQCQMYKRCDACAGDPHCGWSIPKRECEPYQATTGLIQSPYARATQCTALQCTNENIEMTVGATLILRGVPSRLDSVTDTQGHPEVTESYTWYRPGIGPVTDDFLTFMIGRQDNTLILIRPTDAEAGVYELRDETGGCVRKYTVIPEECTADDLPCQYRKQYIKWCQEYEKWFNDYVGWADIYTAQSCPPRELTGGGN